MNKDLITINSLTIKNRIRILSLTTNDDDVYDSKLNKTIDEIVIQSPPINSINYNSNRINKVDRYLTRKPKPNVIGDFSDVVRYKILYDNQHFILTEHAVDDSVIFRVFKIINGVIKFKPESELFDFIIDYTEDNFKLIDTL